MWMRHRISALIGAPFFCSIRSCGEPNGCSLTKAVIAKPALCVALLLVGIYYFNNLLYLLRHLVLGLIGRVSPIHPCVLQLHW